MKKLRTTQLGYRYLIFVRIRFALFLLSKEKTAQNFESTRNFIKIVGSPAAKKATAISIFLCALNQCCGAFSMMNYTNKIFEDAGSTLPSNTASTIVASVQLFANFVTLVLVDCAGRKILLTISALGTAIGLISMAMFDLYKEQLEAYKWISVVAFSMIILAASIGMLPLTFVLPNEILPKKVYYPIFFCIIDF